eukprot:3072302-Karenia_brevis.AAC.1
MERKADDTTVRRQWKVKGLPHMLDAEQVAKILNTHTSMTLVEPQDKQRGGVWIVSAVAPRE